MIGDNRKASRYKANRVAREAGSRRTRTYACKSNLATTIQLRRRFNKHYMSDFSAIVVTIVVTIIVLMFGTMGTILGTCFLKGFQGYGDGQYVGYITGAETRGVIFKTGRVYMKTSLDSSQEDAFCVTDDEVFASLKEAQLTQEKIAVNTKDLGSTFPTECAGEGTSISSLK